MPSTYTANLGLEQPATGEQAGVWGTTVNNTYKFLDAGIDGNLTVPLSASAYTLLTNQGTDSLGRNKVIVFTGALTQDGSISIQPNSAQKIYYVINHTTGGHALNFSQGSGPTFKLLNGYSAVIYADGLGGPAGVFGALADLQVNSLQVVTNLIVGGQVQWGAPATFNQLSTFQLGVVIQAPMTVNLGGDAVNDMYYRGSSGQVTRLPIGNAGYQLTVGTGGVPTWTAQPAPTLPMTIIGASPNYIFTADSSGRMYQDGNLMFTTNQGMGLGAGPIGGRGLVVGRNLGAVVELDVPKVTSGTAAGRVLMFSTDYVPRWQMFISTEPEVADVKSTAGANFILAGYNNDTSAGSNFLCAYRNGRLSIGSVYNDQYDAKLVVINAGGVASTYIQQWLNNGGGGVASLDNSGNLNIAGTLTCANPFLTLNNMKGLEIGVPAAPNHPLGLLHIGNGNANAAGIPSCSICLEKSTTTANLNASQNVVRLFYYQGGFCIQYQIGGVTYYLSAPITNQTGPVTWQVGTSPMFF